MTHCAIKYCKVHHFADDTNLINSQTSVKTINKQINYDLKNYRTVLILTKFC